jgi:hypothetical protein
MGVSREVKEESDAESDPLVSVAAAMVSHLPDSAVELLQRVSAPSADPFIEKYVEDVVKRHAEALATELRDLAKGWAYVVAPHSGWRSTLEERVATAKAAEKPVIFRARP